MQKERKTKEEIAEVLKGASERSVTENGFETHIIFQKQAEAIYNWLNENQFQPVVEGGDDLIKYAKDLRTYFGEHDKTTHEHYLYAAADFLFKHFNQLPRTDAGWVDAKTPPPFIDGKTYSENVFVQEENHTDIQVMCYCEAHDDEGIPCNVWANCYGKIDGEGEWDDNYNVIKWMPIPKLPPENSKN